MWFIFSKCLRNFGMEGYAIWDYTVPGLKLNTPFDNTKMELSTATTFTLNLFSLNVRNPMKVEYPSILFLSI